MSGNMIRDYIFFAGRRIAWRDSSGNVYYHFVDAIGNTRAVTDGAGNTCFNADYYPYGQENDYDSSCTPEYKFAGYEYDSETGNYYAYARYYNPRLGRFMSPDPVGGDILNPQSLNRYTYVINNPATLTDPSGAVLPFTYQQLMQESWGIQAGSIQFGSNWNEFDLINPQWTDGEGFESGIFSSSVFYWLNWTAQFGGLGGLLGPSSQPPPPQNPPCSGSGTYSSARYDFISQNLASAQVISELGGTTAANILGQAALESGWGSSPISQNYGNYFGLTYGFQFAQFSGSPYHSPNGRTYVTFPTGGGIFYSGMALISSPYYGPRIAGTLTPQAYAQALVGGVLAFNSPITYPPKLEADIAEVGRYLKNCAF